MSDTTNTVDKSRQGVRLVGRVINVSPVSFHEKRDGKRADGTPYTIDPHYEYLLTAMAGDSIVRASIQIPDDVPGNEHSHTPSEREGQVVDLPIKSVGKVTKGIWSVYITR